MLRSGKAKNGVEARTELIQLVNGSTGFTVLKFPINPGLPGTFPIGSAGSSKFTDWKMKFMRVDYIPTVSEFATQGQQGEVVIAVDYNADNVLPTAMNQVEDMEPAGGGIPSKGFSFEVVPEYANKSDPKYVRTGAAPAGDDLRLYDGGNLYFAVSGCTNATQIGKLMVTYHFDLMLPTLLNQGGGGAVNASATFFQSSDVEAGGATTVATQMLFATASVNNNGAVNTAGSIVPAAGNYLVSSEVYLSNSTTATTVQFDIQKNAATVFTAATKPHAESSSALNPSAIGITAQAVVSMNGTDALTFVVTATYAGGVLTQWGTVILTPV